MNEEEHGSPKSHTNNNSANFCKKCGGCKGLTKHHVFPRHTRKDISQKPSELIEILCKYCRVEPTEIAKIVIILCTNCHADIEKIVRVKKQLTGRKKFGAEHYMLINLMFLGNKKREE